MTIDLKVSFEDGVREINMAEMVAGRFGAGVGIIVGGVRGERLWWVYCWGHFLDFLAKDYSLIVEILELNGFDSSCEKTS